MLLCTMFTQYLFAGFLTVSQQKRARLAMADVGSMTSCYPQDGPTLLKKRSLILFSLFFLYKPFQEKKISLGKPAIVLPPGVVRIHIWLPYTIEVRSTWLCVLCWRGRETRVHGYGLRSSIIRWLFFSVSDNESRIRGNERGRGFAKISRSPCHRSPPVDTSRG